ncbi:MAG: cobyric acid synthase, partial [Bacteroidales bacterium]|nr:cobyric acid synthase [Bacteroidales bacterium]
IPTFTDIYIEDEDSVSVELKKKTTVDGKVNVAVVLLRRMSNFTDFNRLEQDSRVNLFYTSNIDEVKKADIIIIPGTKSTIADLKEIKSNGIAQAVHQEARNGKTVIGICGGYQMMGMCIEDPNGVEGEALATAGLGILPINTVMEEEKTTTQQTFTYKNYQGCKGYEIHMGKTLLDEDSKSLNILENGEKEGCMIRDNCWGTYMHGVLDNQAVIDDLLAPFDMEKVETVDYETFKQQQYDLLADHVRSVTNMDKFYEILGVSKKSKQND